MSGAVAFLLFVVLSVAGMKIDDWLWRKRG